jgi:hypothetical protein
MPGATDDRRFLGQLAPVLDGLGRVSGVGPLGAHTRGRRDATLVRRDIPVRRHDATVIPQTGQGRVGATAAGLDVTFVDLKIWHLLVASLQAQPTTP